MRAPPRWHEDRNAGMDAANKSTSGRVFLPCRTKCERRRQFSWQVKVSWCSSAGIEADIEISPAPEGARLTSASTQSQRREFLSGASIRLHLIENAAVNAGCDHLPRA